MPIVRHSQSQRRGHRRKARRLGMPEQELQRPSVRKKHAVPNMWHSKSQRPFRISSGFSEQRTGHEARFATIQLLPSSSPFPPPSTLSYAICAHPICAMLPPSPHPTNIRTRSVPCDDITLLLLLLPHFAHTPHPLSFAKEIGDVQTAVEFSFAATRGAVFAAHRNQPVCSFASAS